MKWAEAEPVQGQIDSTYLNAIAATLRKDQAQGFKIVLNYGLQDAPGWLLKLPDARFVNQYGVSYSQEPLPDLVFTAGLRAYAERYTDAVMKRLGANVFMVRVGGGHYGELGFPGNMANGPDNEYWAFSRSAQRTAPNPGWLPCGAGGRAAAGRFLNWYLAALIDYQTWQVQTVRRYFEGQIAVLYPSVGLTTADKMGALADNLCGRTTAELDGTIQRGFDHQGQLSALAALRDPALVVYCTWVNDPRAMDDLGLYARALGLPLSGENNGFNSTSALRLSVIEAREWDFRVFIWIRAQQAYCRCRGWATIDDYQKAIQ